MFVSDKIGHMSLYTNIFIKVGFCNPVIYKTKHLAALMCVCVF